MQGIRHRLAVNESVVFAELDEEVVLLNVETGVYFGLDAIGARIWTLLAGGMDEDSVCERLLDEYEADVREIRADVAGFLDLLVAKSLVRTAGGG
jgi:hypothetical protein